MGPLDIISVQEAKDFLRVNYDEDDEIIEGNIKSAIALIEAKTCHRLWQRTEAIEVTGFRDIYTFPFTITSVINSSNDEVIPPESYTVHKRILRSRIFVSACAYSTVNMTVGYPSKANVPDDLAPLIDACKKMVVHLYNNRDNYEADIPSDIYMLIQPFMRYHGI